MPEKLNIQKESTWDYTELFKDRNGSETYQGRPLIERDSPIAGGVYFGTYGGEAIVVDPEKYPDEYNKLFDEASARATVDGAVSRGHLLRAVFDTVKEAMPYSKNGVQTVLDTIAINQNRLEFKSGTKVDLSSFLKRHTGVCRHQALAVGVTLERFKDEGYIRGDISVDRNINWDPSADKREPGGHAWVRYTNSNGKIFIIDVAQNYIGTLEDSVSKANWNYLRPEEKTEYTNRLLGKAAIGY